MGVLLITCLYCIFGCGTDRDPTKTITIATSANMQFAVKEIAQDFSEQYDVQCDFVISSSGKLTAQIMEGAPYDIFISADLKYPQAIFDAGKATQAPKVYAVGALVLWTMSTELPLSVDSLVSPAVARIALPNPMTAPYGAAAEMSMRNRGIYKEVFEKLVFGESISQVNQFISYQEDLVGFTSRSVVYAPNLKEQGRWRDIPDDLYRPIRQGIIVIERERLNSMLVKAFYAYMFSESAKEVLIEHGYSIS